MKDEGINLNVLKLHISGSSNSNQQNICNF